MELSLAITKGDNGYLIGQLKEIPEVVSQGTTKEALKANISYI